MSLVDEVKQRLDIVHVVSQYVDLDSRSRTPKGLCPFHVERTPSFVVFPDSGTWRCFGGCATGGDAISFVMKKEGLGFSDALRKLADEAGIQYERKGSGEGQRSQTDALLHANEVAAAYFRSLLGSVDGAPARDYLKGRGIDMETAQRRGFGLAPDGIETLAGHLKARGVPAGAAQAAGLVRQGRDGRWHDMFRGRLTIEIRDRNGRLLGFGARSLDGSEPKYINSPRSTLFDKSEILYGLNWAAEGIRRTGTAAVVEGYMDAITAHEAGFDNVVASMGTAITPEQVALLRGLAQTVILALDSDVAGQTATRNSLETVWGAVTGRRGSSSEGAAYRQPDIKVARLSTGKDPDEVIRSDPSSWRSALTNAQSLLEFLLDTAAASYDLTTPQGKARAAEELFPLITRLQNTYEQDDYMNRLAATLGVTREQLEISVSRSPGRTERRSRSRRRGPTASAGSDPQVVSESAFIGNHATAVEDYLLALVVQRPDLREYALGAEEEQFHDPVNRAIYALVKDSEDFTQAVAQEDEAVFEKLERLQQKGLPPMDQREMVNAITDCVVRLHQRHIQTLKAEEERLFSQQEGSFPLDPQEAEALEQRLVETNSRLKHLFARRS